MGILFHQFFNKINKIDKINYTMNSKIDAEKAKEALAYLGINWDYSKEQREIENLGSDNE